MRHLLAHLATYLVAALLLTGATLFAWVRSAQLVLSEEHAVLAAFEPAAAGEFRWAELGADSYVRNCANCHGDAGEGWDQYPALDQAARIHDAPGGRGYLVDVHLYGLESPRWRAPMPPMGHMQDVELAAVINHVLARSGSEPATPGAAPPYLPSDIRARRGLGLSPGAVDARRPSLLSGP